jgi:hypothetical protein
VVYAFTVYLADQAPFTIQFSSAQTAFEILANLTHLPFKTLDELNNHIDDPSNSFMLEGNMHHAFGSFWWGLKKTAVEFIIFYDLLMSDDTSRSPTCTPL